LSKLPLDNQRMPTFLNICSEIYEVFERESLFVGVIVVNLVVVYCRGVFYVIFFVIVFVIFYLFDFYLIFI